MSSTLGEQIKMTIFGESHGPGLGIIIDGVPPGIGFVESDMENDIKKQKF